jgi:hypothetical protein
MKTNIVSLLIVLIFFNSCKTRVAENIKIECKIIKTKDKVEYVNDVQGLEKEINTFNGLIKEELSKFYKSNYRYDFFVYEFISNQDKWLFNRLYFDDAKKEWFLVQQGKNSVVKESLSKEFEANFKKTIAGGFLVQNKGNSGFYKNYLVKYEGILTAQIAVINQSCSLLNTELHPIAVIESKLMSN